MTNKKTPPRAAKKTTKSPPRRGKALKVTAKFESLLGQPRECTECGEEKAISHSTYAPSKKSPDGVTLVCRVCVGRAARTHQLAVARGVTEDGGLPAPLSGGIRGFKADPATPTRAFEMEIDEKVERLTELSRKAHPPQAEIKQLVLDLKAATRCLGDSSGGGQQSDERLAFKAFMAVLKPCVGGWSELGEIHEDLIDALLSPAKRKVLLASRGSAKSTLTCMYALWRLWRNPLEVILIVSRSELLARKELKAVSDYVTLTPLLAELAPLDDQLSSAHQLEVAPAKGLLGMSTSLTCRGMGGQLVGLRASLIIADDVEQPKDDSAEAVDRLEDAIAEFTHIGVPGSTQLLIGTPQSHFSLYGRLSRQPDTWTTFTAKLFTSDFIDGKEVFASRWPSRFSDSDLQSRKRAVSKHQFNLHYRLDLQDTTDRAHPFRLADLPVLDFPSTALRVPVEIRGGGEALPDLPRGTAEEGDNWHAVGFVSDDLGPYTQTVCAVDPSSGLSGGKHDAIGVAIVSVTVGGRAVIRAAQGVRAETTQKAMATVARLIANYGTNKLLIEETAAGLFGALLCGHLGTIGHPLPYEKVSGGGVRKGRRIIESIAPALASGKVVICKDVLTSEDAGDFVSQYSGMNQDARRMKSSGDDVVDALAYALAYCGPALSADDAEYIASARHDYETLIRQPLRRRVLNEDELELLMSEDEVQENVRLKMENAIALQQQEVAAGFHNPVLDERVRELTKDHRRLRTLSRRFVRMPGETD